MKSQIVLSVKDLVMRFGGLLAVDRVSFDVYKNEVFSIIGPNGAGKTTVFNCVSGFIHLQRALFNYLVKI